MGSRWNRFRIAARIAWHMTGTSFLWAAFLISSPLFMAADIANPDGAMMDRADAWLQSRLDRHETMVAEYEAASTPKSTETHSSAKRG